ncbi:MAG: TIGR02678 family protein [Roseburia sp.]|nr:TIGR02678 family protein [Roseburia sp.]
MQKLNRVRSLLENIWICKDTQKDEYYKIKHELPLFQRFVREMLGWKLINTERLLKLEKIPVHAESFMGIQEFTEIRDYCFLCAVLIFLEDKEEQEQFLLSELISYVETRLKESIEIDWTSFSQRKSLVRVLQYMEKNNMLKVYEGNSEGFGQESGNEVLYENTGHSKYFATSFSQDISGFHSVEDFERTALQEIDSERGRTRINRVYRQLVTCPMMYWSNMEDADSLYLKNQRQWVVKNLEENIGGRLDLHKNAAFWMLEEDDCYGKVHPRDAILPEAVLLVCAEIRSRIESGVWVRQMDECVYVSEEALDELIRNCHRRWKDAWGAIFREKEPGKAVEEIKEYMEAWMMFRREEGRISLFPIVGKLSGYYPGDYEEKQIQ